MPGIVFLRTEILSEIVEFYQSRIGMEMWLDQGDCKILRYDNLLLGFCERKSPQTGVMITFYYPSRKDVRRMYESLKEIAECEPRENKKYGIYQFFAKDPEGRDLEFQYFTYTVPSISCSG
ncbi:VOC family protein [Candidatus Thorarchaeota archaeon]|nr:MAG: VOC family protein [Candidatus Thorarchaeota archaeon]